MGAAIQNITSPPLAGGGAAALPAAQTQNGAVTGDASTAKTDDKVNSAATKILSPDEILEASLCQEIAANQKYIAESKGRWFKKIDVSKEETLVSTLAIRLAILLKNLFKSFLSITKTRPMTIEEEKHLANIAQRLQYACNLANTGIAKEIANIENIILIKQQNNENVDNDKLVLENLKKAGSAERNAERAAAEALLRAEAKQKRRAELLALKARISECEEWLKTPRYGFRDYPVFNKFLRTTQGVKLEAAQARVKMTLELARHKTAYPKLLEPKIDDIINAKKHLLSLLTPNSRDYFATNREISDHKLEKENLARINSARK